MRRKADRLAGGKLKDPKQRGEWAELYFMMLAAGCGMTVSRPFGVARYDVGIDHPTRSLRVQVKSTIHWRPGHGYSLKLVGSRRKKYAPGTVDFFAILLIPIDEWYIIPFEVIGEMHCSLHFSPRNQRQKYGKYREAWKSLRGETGLTIHACREDEWADADSSLRAEWEIFFSGAKVFKEDRNVRGIPAFAKTRKLGQPWFLSSPHNLTRSREVRAPAVSDDQPGAQATPGADVLAAVGLQRAIGLVDGDVVAADLDGHVGGVFDADGFETKILISGVAELAEQMLDGLGAVGGVVVRSQECAVRARRERRPGRSCRC